MAGVPQVQLRILCKVNVGAIIFGETVQDIAIGSEGLGFNFRAGQIGHSVANGSPPLRCFFGAVLLRC